MVSESEPINLNNAHFRILDLSVMTVAEKISLKKKLKSELSHVASVAERIEAQLSEMSHKFSITVDSCEFRVGNDCSATVQSLSRCSEDHQVSSCIKRKAVDMYKQCTNTDGFSCGKEMMILEKSESVSVVTGARSLQTLGSGKGHNMDTCKLKQCMLVLNKLMNHKFGWVFNQPVDPVKLEILDYFSIIAKPMDLGTIRKKLKSKLYLDTLDFAVDIRLTFSNAMRYNPPGNEVHVMAKELNNFFNMKWKTLESKWGMERLHTSQQSDVRKAHDGTPAGPVIQEESAYGCISLAKRFLTSADRQMLRNDLAKISERRMPLPLLSFFKRFDICGQKDGRIEVDIDEFDEEALLELHRLVRSCVNPRLSESRGLKNSCEQTSVRELCEADVSRSESRLHNTRKPSVSSCTKGTCSDVNCRCGYHNDFTELLSSDVDSERSSGGENRDFPATASHLTHDNITAGDQRGILNLDSDVAANILHRENVQDSSFPSTSPSTDKKGEEQLIYEEQLSPSKALRAAMLKSRFADTILKAQQKTLLNSGEKGDPAKMQREREKLKRKQQEERARIEAQVKAAEAVAQRKAVEELKLQRGREREAARLALQKMEKTVDLDENQEILRDLEILGYSQPNQHTDLPEEMVLDFMDVLESQAGLGKPLEQLGLFIKNDDVDEEAEDWISAAGDGGVEEGEIGPI